METPPDPGNNNSSFTTKLIIYMHPSLFSEFHAFIEYLQDLGLLDSPSEALFYSRLPVSFIRSPNQIQSVKPVSVLRGPQSQPLQALRPLQPDLRRRKTWWYSRTCGQCDSRFSLVQLKCTFCDRLLVSYLTYIAYFGLTCFSIALSLMLTVYVILELKTFR